MERKFSKTINSPLIFDNTSKKRVNNEINNTFNDETMNSIKMRKTRLTHSRDC